MVKRAAFYIDGYNLYHGLVKLQDERLKWLDLFTLGQRIIPSKSERLVKVHYFSVLAYHRNDPEKISRHQAYLDALETVGVIYTLGYFNTRKIRCRAPHCDHSWIKPEEKETDVNIAVQMMDDAFDNVFDVAYVLSSDGDLAPSVRSILSRFPEKQIVSVAAPGQRHAASIIGSGARKMILTKATISACLFPEQVQRADGSIIVRPPEYA